MLNSKKIILISFGLGLFLGCSHQTKPTQTTYTGIGQESVKPEVLKKFAPEGLNETTLRDVKKILDIQNPSLGRLHPNGKQMFFNWRVSGQNHIWRIDNPKGFPIQLTGGKDATFLNSITPDGKWLIVSRDEDGQENPGLFLQSPNGGSLKTVFKKNKVRASMAFVTDDSQWLYFTANDRSPESYAIYRYHLQKQSTELVFDQPGTWFVADHRKGGELLLVKLTGGKWREYYEWNENKKVLTPLFGQNEKEEYSANYSAHRDELIVLTPKFDEHARLYRYRNGKFTPLSPAVEFEISDFVMDRKKTKILYQLNRNGYTELHGYQALSFEKLKFPTFKEAEHVVLGPISQDGKIISLGVAFPQSPRVSYTYNFENQKLQSWVVPSTPEIDLSRYVKAELEYYPARDGTKIPMFVRRPSHCLKKTCPVVVHFHGGPEAQSLPGFSAYAQLFVDRGFVYVDPNVRGSSGYGKNWLNSDNGPKRLNVISDIEDAALYIKKAWAYDGVTPQVGVMGGSYGGYSTLMAMTFFAGAYDVGVANVGMSNLLSFLQNTAPYRRHLRTSEYGDPEKDREALVQLSPITHINKIRAPLMIIQGVNDPRVPAGEAIQMHEALEKKGISSELILFADEGHGSQKKENQVLEIGHTLEFFEKHLKFEKH